MKLRSLFTWPFLIVELVLGVLRHSFRWIADAENRIHVINFLVIGASTFFLFGTIRMFMPNMPLSIRVMITVIIGGLEWMALEHVAQVLRSSELGGLRNLDLSKVDRRFVAMSFVLAIAASLNIMGSYVDVHYRLAGPEATVEFEEHEAQDIHEAALAEAYPDLHAVSAALSTAERDYLNAAAIAQRGLAQQEGQWAESFYGVGQGAGPRHDAIGRVADVARAEADKMAAMRVRLEADMAELQNAYALGTDAVERDVLRQRAYDSIRTSFDGLALPGPNFVEQVQTAIGEIHIVPARDEHRIPALTERAALVLTATGLSDGPRIPERDVSMRQAIGTLSGHIRYAWHDLLRGGTEAWISAGIALILDGSVLMLSMAWYALFMLPYLIAILIRDILGIGATGVARAAGTLVGRAAMLPSEVAVVGATEYREAWRKARGGWKHPEEEKVPPAQAVLEDVIANADPARGRRIIRIFSKARFMPEIEVLDGPGFVVMDHDLDGLSQDDPLVWNALVTELLLSGADPALLRLETHEGRVVHLFRPEVISAAKRILDVLDDRDEPRIGDTVKKALDKYRGEVVGEA